MKLITKKYLFRNADTASDGLCIKYVTGTSSEHEMLSSEIKADENVTFCACEYVNEVDLIALTTPEIIKKGVEKVHPVDVEKKEEN